MTNEDNIQWIKDSLERIETHLERVNGRISKVETDIAVVKVKSGLLASGISFFGSVIAVLVAWVIKGRG